MNTIARLDSLVPGWSPPDVPEGTPLVSSQWDRDHPPYPWVLAEGTSVVDVSHSFLAGMGPLVTTEWDTSPTLVLNGQVLPLATMVHIPFQTPLAFTATRYDRVIRSWELVQLANVNRLFNVLGLNDVQNQLHFGPAFYEFTGSLRLAGANAPSENPSSTTETNGLRERALSAVVDIASWLNADESEVAQLGGFSVRALQYWKRGDTPRRDTIRRLLSLRAVLFALRQHLGEDKLTAWLMEQSSEGTSSRRALLDGPDGPSLIVRELGPNLFATVTRPPILSDEDGDSRVNGPRPDASGGRQPKLIPVRRGSDS